MGSTFTTKSGRTLQLIPVNKTLLLPLGQEFAAPEAPIVITEAGPVRFTDSPEYIDKMNHYRDQMTQLSQEIYIEFGIEDFEFDQAVIDKYRDKMKRVFGKEVSKSDKLLYIQTVLCQDEIEYAELFTQILEISEPSLAVTQRAREMFRDIPERPSDILVSVAASIRAEG